MRLADVVPGVWIPPVLGKVFIEHETFEQFQEIRDEILKRKQAETNQARAGVRRIPPDGCRRYNRLRFGKKPAL
jgi:predicted oxidoreductase